MVALNEKHNYQFEQIQFIILTNTFWLSAVPLHKVFLPGPAAVFCSGGSWNAAGGYSCCHRWLLLLPVTRWRDTREGFLSKSFWICFTFQDWFLPSQIWFSTIVTVHLSHQALGREFWRKNFCQLLSEILAVTPGILPGEAYEKSVIWDLAPNFGTLPFLDLIHQISESGCLWQSVV